MSHLGERLSALIDGELSHAQRDRVLAHLATCEPCRAEAAALRMLKRRMRALGEATARAGLTDRLMALAAVGPAAAAHPGEDQGAAEYRWPLRSLALTALVVLALALPVAAFMAGGGRQDLGPRVTPPVGVMQQSMFGGLALAPSESTARPTLAGTRPPTRHDASSPGARNGVRRPAGRRSAARLPAARRPAVKLPSARYQAASRPAVRHAVTPPAW